MSKLRVYQIAKDFQISSEALLDVLRGLNVEVKSHMSTVDDGIIEQVRQKFHREQEAVKAEETRKQAAKALADKSHAPRTGADRPASERPAPERPAPERPSAERAAPEAARPAAPEAARPSAAPPAAPGSDRPAAAASAPPTPTTPAPASGAPRPGGTPERSSAPRPGDRPAPPRGPGQSSGGGGGAPRPGGPTSFTPAGGRSGGAGATADARRFGGGPGGATVTGPSASYGGGQRGPSAGPGGPGFGGAPRPGGGGGGPQGNRRKDKKKKRTTDDRLVRESVKKTLATIERGGAKHRRRRVREDGSVIVEEEKLIRVNEFITLSDLADHLEVKPSELIALCLRNGMMVTLNKRLDRTEIELLAAEYGYAVELVAEYGEELLEEEEANAADEELTPRPPVVTIMGHVDHGKTSLLDYVRRTNVVAGEVGGITQHIGAYEVDLGERGRVTFLDTPGHEAFTAMRARGAQATDIVVLVVAADSRVMPQTIEAIDHAREAQVPIVVAINKIDLPDANPALIKGELAKHGLLVEEYGGKTVCAEISAKKGIGVDKLLDLLLLQAELLELKANADKLARGVVIESQVEKGRGIVGTVLVQSGTLSVGDPFLCGSQFGKVRAMANERGQKVIKAGPSTPVEILGWSGTPQAGDSFVATESEQEARAIAQERAMLHREAQRRRGGRTSLTDFSASVGQGEMTELRIILKGDVAGSVEAISEKLVGMGNDEVKCRLIHTGVGQITESDVNLAMASDAVIIGFHVRPDPRAGELARREKVDVRLYEIIYDLTEDIKSALSGLLKPEEVEKVLGVAEVRQVFQVSKAGSVAGCMVTTGSIIRNNKVRLRREGEIVWDGKISTLKRFKDDAREVQAGFECGISLEGHNDVREGDQIESYEIQMIARRVE